MPIFSEAFPTSEHTTVVAVAATAAAAAVAGCCCKEIGVVGRWGPALAVMASPLWCLDALRANVLPCDSPAGKTHGYVPNRLSVGVGTGGGAWLYKRRGG